MFLVTFTLSAFFVDITASSVDAVNESAKYIGGVMSIDVDSLTHTCILAVRSIHRLAFIPHQFRGAVPYSVLTTYEQNVKAP